MQSVNKPKRAVLVFILAAALPACRGGGSDDSGSGGSAGSGGGGGSNAGLQCPSPGTLPFQTESAEFETTEAADIAAYPRTKDEASDILGNPGGSFAFTNMPVEDPLATGEFQFNGRKARSAQGEGLNATGVYGEWVSFWAEGDAGWEAMGRQQTDDEGRYAFSAAFSAGPPRLTYTILEGDGSCAAHYSFLLPSGTKVIVTDIDGTLTSSDDELFAQISDGNYDPKQNQSASALMGAWAKKGYQPVYLTARPHIFRSETRSWLAQHDFPEGPVITANQLVFGDSARTYKRTWVSRVATDLGWKITAAYGNADSDIDAYEEAGIPKDITFIIGENAGQSGTVAIAGNDYTSHISEFVQAQPDAK